jgi:CheY-like chemotaxis protein
MQNAIAQDYRPQTLPKILLVEDFDDTRLMMKMWLEKRGYHVIEAETGEQAITLAQREAPDLIIMALTLRSGYDSIRHYDAPRSLPFQLTAPMNIGGWQSRPAVTNMFRRRLSRMP